MIKTFQHKGIKAFFENGNKAGIQPSHAAKLARQLRQLNDARTAGVCALSAPDGATLARRMASQNGPIRPLLSLREAARPRQLYRFCGEQTVTINTAAAGGNAALLAAGV